ncbi:hypothetical protein [Acetobacter ghanensis]|uniref:Lipoprotein n=1 Tax=Acetobacter ghanensis TaxID=431306 RepID=A0A0U5EZU7_9PROT|nr:hypothetical protein [Acetobacter ghanensis]NHO39634.1 hypothetical protein [Acetobacter ghanensis]GBQ49633.1 hypothetical protein AA18895_1693 [Acetobacter ghanensis DSM 18895]CEF53643.1 hypothetical protein AGA_330 [Acetobacter ghanensis]
MTRTRSLFSLCKAALAATALMGAPLLLSGCGFKPLYGEEKGGVDITNELKDIYVANIPERFGQQLRLALQTRMASDGPEDPHKYKLVVAPTLSAEAIDIHGDNTTGRTRMLATARWQLLTIEPTPQVVTQGEAQTLDGYTTTYEQYFAQTLNMESTMDRVAQALGEQVTQQLATWFKTQTAPASTPDDRPRAIYPSPNLIPDSDQNEPMEKEGADAIPDMATGRAPIDTNF